MPIVEANKNPIVINETKMGRILKKSTNLANIGSIFPINKKPKIVDLKTGRVYKGQDAKDIIDSIDDNSFIDVNRKVIDTGKDMRQEKKEARKKAEENPYRMKSKPVVKTVNYTRVK